MKLGREGDVPASSRVLSALEPIGLVAVPVALVVAAVADVPATAGLTMLVVIVAVLLMLAGYERSRPALRQVMPTVVLASLAAAGRILFAPIPDFKPVSAIAIVAGACLGRRDGFMVGALAALVSNAFFGQGAWTPWQMYAWGLIGYLSGVMADQGLIGGESRLSRALVYVWGFCSALLYGLLLNGWYVVAFVRPLTWPSVVAAFAAGLPWDCIHGVATVVFLLAVWAPWARSIRRVVAKYGLG
ncbi:MAG: ECF transporter S component [Atopobiaceae bacterium]|nr:ECF transporter S component [Atopobiaceae bacterium]MCI2173482.1 ECF transporter S component [Atopobiaceae bacterium]MCI2207477.1 ECF transporter S component [Atopobiaceae bacterium]